MNEQCSCVLCGAVFADALAWAAHRPWRNRWQRDRCRWPNALYNSAGAWTLRPFAADEIKRVEEGPADDWKARPATTVAITSRSRARREALGKGPSNGAGSRGSLAANRAGVA